MFTQLLILVLLVGIGVYGYRVWQSQRVADDAHGPSGTSPGLMGVQPGAILQLPPFGPDHAERDVEITARHRYRENGYEWIELACDAGDETYHLDLEHDDALEAHVTLMRLSLDEIGLAADALDGLADGATVTHDGTVYRFAESGRARFFADGLGEGEAFEYWDFADRESDRSLAIERWGAHDCRAYIAERLNPERIRIYRAGATT